MADASLQIGNGNWAVKPTLLLGYNVISERYSPVEIDVNRNSLGSRVNSSGVIDYKSGNTARINYENGVGSLLLEPERTNLLVNSVWAGGGSIPTSWLSLFSTGTSTAVASIKNPNVSAYRFVTSTQRQEFYQNITLALNSITTISVYVESVATPIIVSQMLRVSASAGGTGTVVYLKNNVVINSSTNVEAGNTYSLQFTCTLADTFQTRFGVGVGANITGDITLSMPQVEQGVTQTSFIPTTTTSLIRNLDDIFRTGISYLLNPSEGTFYVEIAALTNDLTSRSITLSDNSDYNQVTIQFSSISNQIRMDTYGKRSTTTTTNFRRIVTVSDTTTFHKVAIVWGANGIFGFVDGVKYTLTYAAGDPAGNGIPTDLTRLDFKQYYGGNYFYGKNKALGVWKTALTDTEAIALTTL